MALPSALSDAAARCTAKMASGVSTSGRSGGHSCLPAGSPPLQRSAGFRIVHWSPSRRARLPDALPDALRE